MRLVFHIVFTFVEILIALQGKSGNLSASKVKNENKVLVSSEFVTVGRNVWNCHELNACDDKLGLEAILLLHQRLDDDANGNIDIAESDDFLRDELKYSNSYERQKGFHRNDKHITADELWLSWKISEVHNWTIQETVNWLVLNVELPQYTQNFLDNSIDGTALPRMAVNSLHFLSNLGIKDPIHKQKISLKAMDIVLFGPPKNHNYVKDGVLILSLIIATCGCWFAYIQHKKAQSHLKKTMKDMDNLQHAEESLRELQKELDEARQQQELAASEKKNLERQLRNEIEAVKHQYDSEASGDSKVQALEQELRIVMEDLRSAEKTLEENCWVASPALQQWLQLTYEMELQHYNAKKSAAEHQLLAAKEGCEKLRKKRSSFLGTFRVAHGSSIDDVDNRISQAKAALSEVTKDLQERLNRWKQIEMLCGFPVVHNPGIRHLKSLLGNSAIGNMFSTKACGVHNVVGNRSIEVLTEDHKVEVTSEKQVRLDGHKYNAAQLDVLSKKSDRSLIIEILGAHVIVKSPEIGFDLTYNTLGQLTIKVLPSLKNQLAGLCGFYNDKEGFTLLKPDKTIAYTSKDFGDSWATEEGEDDCKEILCDIETRSLGVKACKELTDEDFAACYEVLDLKDYMYTCQDFMCECLDESSYEECKCKSFTQIIEKCSNKLGENALKGWRVKHNCSPPPCPEGFVWDDCGPSCQITCGTLTSSDLEGCEDECMSGCFCPTGNLLDGDRCVPPDQCSNEVCHGFGDPHMETFDGYFFPMQAEGTFLFAADEGAEFAVQGITEPCRPGSKRITCITGIKVTHYGHTVTVRKNEPLLVDEEPMTVEKWPLNVYGMTVIGYPGNTYVVLITSLSVDVRYYGDNSGFAIKIPATRFFNRTLGLCGNCDGKVDENPKKEYACGWLVKGNKGDCLDSFENLPPAVDVVDSCLALMDEETFGTCHALVNPKNYVDACSFDVTYSEKEDESVCKTLKEYTRQCCQAGVVIDKWPEKFGCDTGCENNLEYSSCHDGCPQTCESTKNNFLVLGCEKIMLDGCFCSEGTVFKDGRCIPDELCDACDDDGHMPGDSWSPETCKNCTCKSNLLVSCSTESCPPKPICRSGESLVKQNSNGESCCDSYSCVVSPVFCPPVEEIPSCGEGEIVKTINDEDLCPKFECVCDPVTCASVIFPQDLEDGQIVNINKEGCCPKVVVECHPEACPEKPTCTAGMVPAEYEGECCILFRCKPPTDVCVYTHHYEIVHGEQAALEIIDREPVFYRPGETWQDGLCENCTCVENDDQLRPLCVMEQCPTIENMPDNKDYELVEYPNPRKCCPDILKLHCKDKYGNLYVPGDEWQSEEDPCTKYTCESKENGDAQMGKKVLTCPECPKTSDYVPPSKILGQCCGFCRPAKCEEDGHIYVIGEEWVLESNPCRKAQCVNDFGGVKIVYTEKSCPVIPEDCPTNKIIDDEKGCCRICNETTEMKCNSLPIPIAETIGFFQFYDPSRGGQCTNTKAVPEILKCSGACHSQSYYSVEDGDFKSVCQCCKVNVTVERMVEMECPDGSVLRKEYMQPQTCQCSKCAPEQKVDLWTNSGQKGFKKSESPWLQNTNQQQGEDAFNFQQEQREFDFQYPQQEEEDEFLPFLRGNDQVEQEGDDYDFYSSNPYLQRKRKSPQSMDVENTSDHKSTAKRQEVQNSKEMEKRMLPFSDFKIPTANEYAKFTSLWEGAKDKVKDVDLPSFSSMYEGAKGKIKGVELPDFSSMYEGAKDKVKDVELPDFPSMYEGAKDKVKSVELPDFSSMYEGAKDKVKSVEFPDFSSMYEGAKDRVKDIKLPSFSSFYEGTKRNFKQMEVPSYLHNTREARKR